MVLVVVGRYRVIMATETVSPAGFADFSSFVDAGREKKVFVDENSNIATAEIAAVIASVDTPACAFTVSELGLGFGAFADRALYRGDLILAEKPLYTVGQAPTPTEVLLPIGRLTRDECASMTELRNAYPDGSLAHTPLVGTHQTNTFAAGRRGRDRSLPTALPIRPLLSSKRTVLVAPRDRDGPHLRAVRRRARRRAPHRVHLAPHRLRLHAARAPDAPAG